MGLLIGFLIGVAFAVICVLIANSKGRNPWLWGILGFFFGLITLIVIAVLPSTRPSGPDGENQRCREWSTVSPMRRGKPRGKRLLRQLWSGSGTGTGSGKPGTYTGPFS